MAEEPVPILRRILPFLSVAIVIAALYVGWTFYSRWSDAREADEANRAKETERARDTLDRLGYGPFKILNFYASPGMVTPGENASLCYGVSGAKSIRLDPPVVHVYPAVSNCVQVQVKKTTQYTLTIEDGSGHTASQSVEIEAHR